ncbi:MAG TPA: DEAD/DEAH box helicase, partial [Methanomicrobiales archaeon]|nr:DEAD/DEAH box helicase [Methanomicrobiales archaeon]
MKTVAHPLIREGCLEERQYQLSLALRALDGNTMIVLPTGLGKTAIALLVAASRLYTEGGRVLFLAPTKPLVEQHLRFFERFLVPRDGSSMKYAMFTGETPPEERKAAWMEASVCFATPQVIKNDIIAGRYGLQDVTLMIVDECHRAVGNYAYVYLAKRYLEGARSPLLLAITASPGGDKARIREVCENLGIQIVETRTEEDPDVSPYVHERELQIVNVDLPAELGLAVMDLNELIESRLQNLKRLNFTVPKRERLSMRALEVLNAQIQKRIGERDRSAFLAASLYAECMKIRHAIALAEAQGSTALTRYLEKLSSEAASGGGSKASLRLSRDPVFHRLLVRSQEWKGELHPKLGITRHLVQEQFEASPDSRIIIFATYRDTVQLLVDYLNRNGIPCRRFVGQATKDQEKGLSQKMQIDILKRFREGEFRVLIATSVGEEGLDVPSTDMVIFYEAVPSEIRSIQ